MELSKAPNPMLAYFLNPIEVQRLFIEISCWNDDHGLMVFVGSPFNAVNTFSLVFGIIPFNAINTLSLVFGTDHSM